METVHYLWKLLNENAGASAVVFMLATFVIQAAWPHFRRQRDGAESPADRIAKHLEEALAVDPMEWQFGGSMATCQRKGWEKVQVQKDKGNIFTITVGGEPVKGVMSDRRYRRLTRQAARVFANAQAAHVYKKMTA